MGRGQFLRGVVPLLFLPHFRADGVQDALHGQHLLPHGADLSVGAAGAAGRTGAELIKRANMHVTRGMFPFGVCIYLLRRVDKSGLRHMGKDFSADDRRGAFLRGEAGDRGQRHPLDSVVKLYLPTKICI